jgi:iron complex outermembrane receptor protein
MNCSSKHFLWYALVPITPILITNTVHAAPNTVTDVQLKSTANESLQLLIITSTSQPIQTLQTPVGEQTLIIDIPNTQLQLPERESIRWSDPSVEITEINVTQQSPDTIQIRIRGATTAPEINVTSTSNGLAINLPQQGSLAETTPDNEPTPTAEASTEDDVIELVVTATRTEEESRDIPRSTTVVSREEIEQQSQLSNNLPDILGNTVPGLGPPSQSASNRAQSLRGRQPSVLIDGVPVDSNLSIFQDLRSISPDAVERVEVVRGSTSIYGAQAGGGVINIITRQPEDQPFIARTKFTVGPRLSLSNFEQSFGAGVEQFFSGTVGSFDYVVASSYEGTGNTFDGEGDIIPVGRAQGLDNLETFNLLAKAGLDLTQNQRLQLTVNYFDDKQDPPTRSDASVNDPNEDAERVKAQPLDLDGELELENLPGREDLTVSLNYSHDDFLGNLDAQVFYKESTTLAIPVDDRTPRSGTGSGEFRSVSQTITESEKWGARVDIETPLTNNLDVLWGADYSDESIEQPLEIFNPVVFDQSGETEFEQIEEAFFSPPYDLESIGLFSQLNWEANEKLAFSGGLRFERFQMSVDDYNVFGPIDFPAFPDAVIGGEVTFDDVVFNLGAVYDLSDEVNVFANFSQGFSAPDFRRFLRRLPRDVDTEGTPDVTKVVNITEPVIVDNYEIGIRGNWNSFQTSLTGFFTYSELGLFPSTLEDGTVAAVRSPTRTYGIEATADYQASEQWELGSTFTWTEGDSSPEDVDGFVPLSTQNIQPIKLSFYVENQTTSNWSNRLQVLIVSDRDRAFEETDAEGNPIDPFPIEGYTTVDWVSNLQLGNGTLSLAVQNLFDNQYFPIDSQFKDTNRNSERAAALGRTVSLQYQFSW